MSEEDARRELELLLARDIGENDPLVAHYAQHVRSIRVSLRSGPPGVGKTWNLSKDWERFPGKKLLLSHSHKYLTEQEERWSKRMKVRHLWGLRWKCPCLNTEEYYNEVIAKLVELKLSHSHVCSTCKLLKAYPQNACPYKNRFKNLPNVVIAPIEYAYTNLLNDYEPDYIAVDDCTLKMRIHPSRQTLEHYLQHLQHMYYENVKAHGVTSLRELFSLNEKDYQSFMKKMRNAHRSYLKSNVEEIIEGVKGETFLHVAISPDEIDTYRKHARVYGFKNRFATPTLFPLFDYVAKCKIENDDEPQLKIIDAIIKDEIFEALRTRYLSQENVFIDFRDDGFDYTIEDKGSVVYRCRGRKDAWYPTTTSIVKNTQIRQNIRRRISEILEKHYNNGVGVKIGVVTPKRCDWQQFISQKLDTEDVKALTFGNLRGKNYLEDRDIVFIIGTYNTDHEALIEDFNLMFAYEPARKDYMESERHGSRYHFNDRELDAYRWAHEEYEQYQAFHRIRPLLHKKTVYGFCLIPKEIEGDGILVKDYKFKKGGVGLKRSEWLLEYVRQHGKVLMRETSFVIVDEFNISLMSAYRLIHKVVDSSKRLSIILREGRQWLTYEGE